MQSIVRVVLITALLLSSGWTQAAEAPYLSLGIGSASATDASTASDAAAAALLSQGAATGNGSRIDEEQGAWLIGFGWPVAEDLALELTYADLGRIGYTLTTDGDRAVGDTETRAAALAAVPGWEFGPVRLMTRLGLAYWARQSNLSAFGFRQQETAYGAGPVAGAGIELDLGRRGYRWRLRLEWDRYFSVGDDDRSGETDIDLLHAGLVITQ